LIKVAIIGGTGLLGSNLIKLYTSKGIEVKAFSRKHSTNIENRFNHIIDFNNLELELTEYFKMWRPDMIINTIALVNLSECEKQKEYCYKVNVGIAEKLAIIAKLYHSYYVHVSTDHYYNDIKHKHTENDPVVFLNYYAETKRQAEKQVLFTYKNSLIVRTNIIGFRKNGSPSFFEWLLNAIKEKEKILLFTNFYTSPINVNQLGEIFIQCFEKKIRGIYNIGSTEVINKYDFGIKVAKKFGYSIDNMSNGIITNNPSNDLDRALTLGLNTTKIEHAVGYKMPTVDETLDSLYKEYEENNEQ